MSTDITTHPTVDDLRLGLPHILDSPQDEGVVQMLVVRPAEDERATPPTVEVSADHGVLGDHWATGKYRGHPDTQITIINARLLDLVSGGQKRWSLAGDNIVADLDISHANLV
ncbi:MAG: MOSC domain-containing protein, partial [Acidimicrobiia bacterium]